MTEKKTAGAGYPTHRLNRALQTALGHADAGARKRAEVKIRQWSAVLEGMADGQLTVGSRTPVADTPPWVTLEVAHGGFATGAYLAEGPLQEDELTWLSELKAMPGQSDRERLNRWFLSDEGQDILLKAIDEGTYRVDVPEQGAWLVLAWLIRDGQDAAACDLVATLWPLAHRLRFYPRLQQPVRTSGTSVHVASVGEINRNLEAVRAPDQWLAMTEALTVWNPLYDELVSLWLDTVQDEWPCRTWPKDWASRRTEWLGRYKTASRAHLRCSKHKHPKSNFSCLARALDQCPKDSRALKGRDVGRVRQALQRATRKRGSPNSKDHLQLRETQQEIAARPMYADVAKVLSARLHGLDEAAGLASLDLVQSPIAASESPTVPEGTAIPACLRRKSARALQAPVDELIERGIIGAAEIFAEVLPQITASVASAGLRDPGLAGVYESTYTAFRRRRSLLLLNLEHQVGLGDLPWITALSGSRRNNLGIKKLARQTLEQVSLLAMTSFPQTILPNPLVSEMSSLVKQAGLELPLVEEIAADIFMGTFTSKWAQAAMTASQMLRETVYGQYYDLPASTDSAPKGLKKLFGKKTAPKFAELCQERATEVGATKGWSVASQGAVLEQSQILTTQNLAVLTCGLNIEDRLRASAPDLAQSNFRWVVQRQAQTSPSGHAELIMLKNTAYAWRQAIFYLALCDSDAQQRVFSDLETVIAEGDGRLAPAVAGLHAVLAGDRFGADGLTQNGHRRFLGWSVGPHWLSTHKS